MLVIADHAKALGLANPGAPVLLIDHCDNCGSGGAQDVMTVVEAILAIEANGKPLSVRDKGPIWLLYPFDSDARYQTEVIYARSIWQIERMEVIE